MSARREVVRPGLAAPPHSAPHTPPQRTASSPVLSHPSPTSPHPPPPGYMYCNLPGLTAKRGSTVRYVLVGMGSEADMHSPIFEGQVLRGKAAAYQTAELMPTVVQVGGLGRCSGRGSVLTSPPPRWRLPRSGASCEQALARRAACWQALARHSHKPSRPHACAAGGRRDVEERGALGRVLPSQRPLHCRHARHPGGVVKAPPLTGRRRPAAAPAVLLRCSLQRPAESRPLPSCSLLFSRHPCPFFSPACLSCCRCSCI